MNNSQKPITDENGFRYWIAKPCKHWTAEKNRRFSLHRCKRIEKGDRRYPDTAFHPGRLIEYFDAERREWRVNRVPAPSIKRYATAAEIAGSRQHEMNLERTAA